jgi:cytochrome c oxidase assembly protein subunit 11
VVSKFARREGISSEGLLKKISVARAFTSHQLATLIRQRLEPGQQMRMPVLFFVDPKIMDDPDARDIQEITLSYTFHPVDEGKKAS